MREGLRRLRGDEPLAVELTAILKQGDVRRLTELLAADPGLVRCLVEDAKGGGRPLLHLFADWPGHHPNPKPVVQALAAAGADLNAPAAGMCDIAAWLAQKGANRRGNAGP